MVDAALISNCNALLRYWPLTPAQRKAVNYVKRTGDLDSENFDFWEPFMAFEAWHPIEGYESED